MTWFIVFYVHGSVHRESMLILVQQDATMYSLLYFCNFPTVSATFRDSGS